MIMQNFPAEFRKFPKHWDVLPFNKAFFDKTGGNPKIKRNKYKEVGELPVIDQGQEYIGGYTNDLDLKCNAPLPCILFGDHTKVLKYVDFPFALGADGVKVLIPNDQLHRRFSYYYINQLRLPDNVGYSRHFKFLKESYVPIPPIEEQKRIAAILDKADAISRKRRQAIQLADEFLRSVFLDMFGDPVTNPKGWRVRQLQDIVKNGTTVTYGIVQAGPHIEGGVPYIKSGDIKNGKVISNNLSCTSTEIASKFERSTVRENEIVISIRATVGTIAKVPKSLDGANLTQGTARISPGSDILADYLFHLLYKKGSQFWITNQIKGATFREITLSKLRTMPIMIAPISLQKQFVEIVEDVAKLKRKLDRQVAESKNLFNSFALRAFRGEF